MNESLIRDVMAKIRQNPEEWDQNTFTSVCGTRACFAGWALRLSGFGIVHGVFVAPEGMKLPSVAWRLPGYDWRVHADIAAQLLLGLDDQQACGIFFWEPSADPAVEPEAAVEQLAKRVEQLTGLKDL